MISLNLLPPDNRRRYQHMKALNRWKGGMLVLTIGCVVMNAVLLAASTWLASRESGVTKRVAELTVQIDQSDVGKISRDISHLDTTLDQLRHIVPSDRAWSQEISSLLADLPSGITISDLTWTAGGDLTLKGTAAFRADFINLDTLLKQHPNLENVATASQASRRDNLPFEYTAHWKSS